MTDEALSSVLFWYGLAALVIVAGGYVVTRFFDRSTPTEIAEKQAQALPEQITKEFNRRPRMGVVRFFNAFFD